MEEYNLLISKEYHNVSVQQYEEIYFYLDGIENKICEHVRKTSNSKDKHSIFVYY